MGTLLRREQRREMRSRNILSKLSSSTTLCRSTLISDGFQKRWVQKVILHKEIIQKDRQQQQLEWERRKRAIEASGRDPVTNEVLKDMPDQLMENPFKKSAKKCFLCEKNIEIDYKNVKLLSQFVSSHTGQIYGRAVTGLCLYMQKRIALNIIRARNFGYMSYWVKNP